MSRRGFALGLGLSLSQACLIGASPALAQTPVATDAKIEAMIARAREAYSLPAKPKRCGATADGEIVVCAPDRGERWRVPPTSETDPNSRAALRDGVPRAPNVAGRGIFSGPPTVGGLCVLPPCPPPPAYMIDLSTIPEAPEGSDADRIAKGEMRAP